MAMKKKYKITIGIIVFIILSGISLLLILNYQNKKAEAERIKQTQIKVNNINLKYAPFKTGSMINDTDEISIFLNSLVDTHTEINSLKDENNLTISSIKKLDDLLVKLNEKKEKVSNLNYEDIDKYLITYSKEEKEALLNIYNGSKIIQNKSDDLKIKENYLDYLENDIKTVSYLKEHKNDYYLENNKIVYKNDSFKTAFRKLNTDLKIEKEIDKGVKIPILMYHGIENNAWGDTTLFVKTKDFDEQMKYLSDNGYTPLFLSQIKSATNYEKPIIITFDDGYKDNYDNAFPILQKFNFKADIFVITDWLDGKTYMTQDMVKKLDSSGLIEIGSHTLAHVALGTVNDEEQEKQLFKSKEELDALLGKETLTIAYPFGSFTSTTVKVAKKYYKYGVTVSSGLNYSKTYSSYTLNRIKVYRNMSIDTFKKNLGGNNER